MDRPRRAATKVTNFRKYHLSGDLDQTLQGVVDSRITHFEMAQSTEELQKQLEEEKVQTKRMLEDMECMKIEHELETHKLQQKQWQATMEQLKEAREHAEQEHTKYMEGIKEMTGNVKDTTSKNMLDWFKSQTEQLTKPPENHNNEEEERARQEQEARDKEIRDLKKQQEDIAYRLVTLTGAAHTANQPPGTSQNEGHLSRATQDILLDQLKGTLSSRKEEDPNRLLLKAFITSQNKTTGEGGTNTLKPAILGGISNPDTNGMAEWLASLNRQEEGESEIARLTLSGEGDPGTKSQKNRSGILDKATTNIQQKQVWPQQNLGEDWADEDIEFKQLRFEHLVAGNQNHRNLCRSSRDTGQTQVIKKNRIYEAQRL